MTLGPIAKSLSVQVFLLRFGTVYLRLMGLQTGLGNWTCDWVKLFRGVISRE